MATLQATVASLQATVATQATTNAGLVARVATLEATPNPTPGPTAAPTAAPSTAPTAVPTATPSASPTPAACEGVSITSDAELALAVPVTRTCVHMIGNLYVRGTDPPTWSVNGTLLAEAFPNLRHVTGHVGVDNHRILASLDGAFPQIQTVSGNLQMFGSPLLTAIGSSFSNMRSVGGRLTWAANGMPAETVGSTAGSRAFCRSARAALCPTSTYYYGHYGDSSEPCCNAYCGTTTDC